MAHELTAEERYEAALQAFGLSLRDLRARRGNPSYDRIHQRGLTALGKEHKGTACSKGTMSTVFGGTAFLSLDRLMWLVRVVMSWDESGAECKPPRPGDASLVPWRERWFELNELRAAARREARAVRQPPERHAAAGRPAVRQPPVEQPAVQQAPVEQLSVEPPLVPHGLPFGDYGGEVNAVAFSPDGYTLAVGDEDGSLTFWTPWTRRIKAAPEELSGRRLRGSVACVAYSRSGRMIAVGRRRPGRLEVAGRVEVWTSPDHRDAVTPVRTDSHFGDIRGLAFSPDERLLAVGQAHGTIRLLKPDATDSGSGLTGLGRVASLAFSADGRQLAVATAESVQLWNPATRSFVAKPVEEPATAVAYSPDGTLLAAATEAGGVRLWDAAARRPLGILPSPAGAVLCLALTGDGMLAAGTRDGAVQLWAARSRTFLGTLTGHSMPVRTMAFSPTGMLATGSADGMVQLWRRPDAPAAPTAPTALTAPTAPIIGPDEAV